METVSRPIPKGRLSKIKGVIFDVDGVLTDCRIWMACDGTWRRAFTVRDGIGIKALLRAGYKVGWITGSESPDIQARAKMLGVEFLFQGQEDKQPAFEKFLVENGLHAEQVACIGDDLADLSLLKRVGFSATVPEAVHSVLMAVDHVTDHAGGNGAARDFCELILDKGFYSLNKA